MRTDSRDLALAALLGPGLVVGLVTTLDGAGVVTVDGLLGRLVALAAVALALGVLTVATGLRRPTSLRRRPHRRGTVS